VSHRNSLLALLGFTLVLALSPVAPAQAGRTCTVLVEPGHLAVETLQELVPGMEFLEPQGEAWVARMEPRRLNALRRLGVKFTVLEASAPTMVVRQPSTPRAQANPLIAEMLTKVSQDSIGATILALQDFQTRHEYTDNQDSAGVFLYNEFIRRGIPVEYDAYSFGIKDFLDMDFVTGSVGWDAGGPTGTVVGTTDGGATWTAQSPGGGNYYLYGVDFVGPDSGWVVGEGGRIRFSSDGGTNWSTQTSGTGQTLFDVKFTDPLNGWIVGAGGRILRTLLGGNPWASQASGTGNTLRGVDFIDPNQGWAVGQSGTILHTTDGGNNWVPQASLTTQYLRSVDFLDALRGWVAGEGNTILHTTDGGSTWLPQNPPAGSGDILRCVSFADSLNGWIADYDGRILNTTDGGNTWTIQYEHVGWSSGILAIRAVSVDTIMACGYSGTLLRSTDGGGSWTLQVQNLPFEYKHDSNNVVATIAGETNPGREVVIVGHYDSYSNQASTLAPGANDNATGTAAVVEAARICQEYRFENTVRFICVSGEELGMMGSDHYAFMARDRGDTILGAINGDMIGYPVTGDTMRVVVGSYLVAVPLVDSIVAYNAKYGIGLSVVTFVDSTGASDYGPFALAGYEASDFAEATAEEIWGGADPYYHTTMDTYDKLSPGMIQHAVMLELASLAELAEPAATGVTDEPGSPGVKSALQVLQNSPNPFSGTTSIRYSAPPGVGDPVSLRIYNVAGQLVRILGGSPPAEGMGSLSWDGADGHGRRVSPGVYLGRLISGSEGCSVRMVLTK
jgi:photosystem II stability/assembly factor-like uncharacterized protein